MQFIRHFRGRSSGRGAVGFLLLSNPPGNLAKERTMKLMFVTEAEENQIGIRSEYSKQDINDLNMITGALKGVIRVLSFFDLYDNGRDKDRETFSQVITALEFLVPPVLNFFDDLDLWGIKITSKKSTPENPEEAA
jgi:hypothetical protein